MTESDRTVSLYVRSAAFYLGMVGTTLTVGLSLSLIGWLLPLSARQRMTVTWARINLWLLRVICRLDYEIRGAEHLPQGPAIVMAKHQSAWETIALRVIVRLEQSWILKKELMTIPVFGWGLALTHQIPIDRSAGREAIRQLVDQGSVRLAEGQTVMVFPEGTRTAPGERRKYRIGGAVLAEHSGVSVIPIAHNAGIFWRRRAFVKYPGRIQVVVGPPIDSRDKSANRIIAEVEDWIEGTQAGLPGATTTGSAVDNI